MQLTVVVDNFCEKASLMAEWGYSVHLETPHGSLLLDTGGRCKALLHNMAKLGLDPEKVEHIVLSHGHDDHTAGLQDILVRAPHAAVWGARSIAVERLGDADAKRFCGGGPLLNIPSMRKIDAEAVVVPGVTAFVVPQKERDPAFQVEDGLWEVAEDGRIVPDSFADDLSLLVEGKHGVSLLLGCAHTGLPNILEYVRRHFGIAKLYAVLGGTHLSAFSDEQLAVCIERFKAFSV